MLDRVREGYRAAGDTEDAHRVTGRLADAHYRAGTSTDALGPLTSLADADPAQAAAAASPVPWPGGEDWASCYTPKAPTRRW